MNLTQKSTLGIVIGVLVIQSAFALVRVRRERVLFLDSAKQEEAALGRTLALAAEVVAKASGEAAARQLVERADGGKSNMSIRWVELDGAARDAPRAPLGELSALAEGRQVSVHIGVDDDATVLTYTPVRIAGRGVAVEIADRLSDESAYMRRSLLNAALSTGLLVALCGGVGWLVGLLFVGRPIRALVEQARRVGGGDLDQRLAFRQRDEIGTLAHEMNAMVDALDASRREVEAETAAKVEALSQLRHVDRLRAVGTMASGVAHELGTPINVVDGHAQLIREDPAGPAVAEHAAVIAHQARRMTRIIRQLLDFARREHRGGGNCSVASVARRVLEMTRPLALKHGVEPSIQDGAAGALVAVGDEDLTQVLLNVVINGAQAMPEGGKLVIDIGQEKRAPPWKPGQNQDVIRVTVRDEGVGMDAETAERLFEPFYTTKDVGEGTGLGLSVAYGIVSEHDGWIEVDTAPDTGSSFHILLPRESAA